MRLAVDLGLHYEDGSETEEHDGPEDALAKGAYVVKKGKRQWMQDLRRRLWW